LFGDIFRTCNQYSLFWGGLGPLARGSDFEANWVKFRRIFVLKWIFGLFIIFELFFVFLNFSIETFVQSAQYQLLSSIALSPQRLESWL
jgi:hypothetical protein